MSSSVEAEHEEHEEHEEDEASVVMAPFKLVEKRRPPSEPSIRPDDDTSSAAGDTRRGGKMAAVGLSS